MIAAWMLYSAACAALLAGGALALDRALRLNGRASRMVWALAIAGSVLLPAATLLPSRRAPAAVAIATPREASAADADRIAALLTAARDQAERAMVVAPDRAWPVLDRPLRALWLAGSAGVLGWLLLSHRRLRRRQAAWSETDVAGERVLVSTDVGPAVVGLARARIVLPRWALALDDRSLALMLAHEREHLRARDPLLLGAAAVAAALVPWSPAVWWQLHRLRLATEIDCDRRVLRDHPDVRTYGRLLLDVARHSPARSGLPIAALASPATSLERRIRTMTMRRPRHATAHALGLTAATALLVVAACETPRPTGPTPRSSVALQDIRSASPSVAPDTGVTIDVVRSAIARHLPALATATGRTQRAWFVVDASGAVVQAAQGDAAPRTPLTLRDVEATSTDDDRKVRFRISNVKVSGGAPMSMANIDPSAIASVEVLKLGPGRVAADSVGVVWIRLRAPGDRSSGLRLRATVPNAQVGGAMRDAAGARESFSRTVRIDGRRTLATSDSLVPTRRPAATAIGRDSFKVRIAASARDTGTVGYWREVQPSVRTPARQPLMNGRAQPAPVQLRRDDSTSSTVVLRGANGTTSSIGVRTPLSRTRPDGSSREPLYIIGGREMSADAAQRVLDSMDASDVATMEVLDSETAVARYGARAAHGAIIFKSNRTLRRDTIQY